MRHRVLWLFAVLMFAFGGTAYAAPPTLDLKPALSDALQMGRWQTAIVTLSNPDSGEALQGEVQVTVDDPRTGGRLATYTRPVTLPNGAGVVRVPVYLFVPANSSPELSVYLVSGREGKGDIVTRRRFEKIPLRADALTLLAVSGTPDTLRYLQSEGLGVYYVTGGLSLAPAQMGRYGIPPPAPPGRGNVNPGTPVRVSNIADPALLPERAVGLEMASIVYLGPDVPPDAFSEGQIGAVRAWVAGGGLLVFHGDKLRGDERFRVWFPPVPTDKNRFTTRKIGRGTVIALGMDPNASPLAGTPAALSLWTKAAKAGVSPPSLGRSLALEDSYSYYGPAQMATAVLHAPGLAAPGVGNVGLFMLIYLVLLVPVNYLILKRMDRREWTWVTIPVLVLLFTLGSYWFGLATKGAQLLQNTAAYVEMQTGSGETLIHGVAGVFSPARRRYQVAVAAPDAALWSARTSYGPDSEYGPIVMADTANGPGVRDAEISMWAMRAFGFRTSSVRLGDGIVANLRLQGITKVVGTVENRTGKTLEQVRVGRGSSSQEIGTLAPGAKASVSLNYVPYYNGSSSSFRQTGSGETRTIEDVKRAIADDLREAPRYQIGQRAEMMLGQDEVEITALNYDTLVPVTVDGQTVPVGAHVNYLLMRATVSGDFSKIPKRRPPVRTIRRPTSRPPTPRPRARTGNIAAPLSTPQAVPTPARRR